MLQPNDLPLVCLPIGLSGDDAAKLIEFLTELTEALERHYFAQLHQRSHHEISQPNLDINQTHSDPPF